MSKPRVWWIEEAEGIVDNDEDYVNEVYVWGKEPLKTVKDSSVQVIEMSAFNAIKKELDDLNIHHGYVCAQLNAANTAAMFRGTELDSEKIVIYAREELVQAKAEIESWKVKNETLQWSKVEAKLEQAKAEIERLKERIEILNKGWPAGDILHLAKELEQARGLLRDHEDDWKRIQDAERALEQAKAEIDMGASYRAKLKEMITLFERDPLSCTGSMIRLVQEARQALAKEEK